MLNNPRAISPFANICQQFALGSLLAPPQPISGGLLHQLWHIQAERGEFAVKKINSQLESLLKTNLLTQNQTQAIAAQLQVQGIACIPALTADYNNYIFRITDQTFMVFPWINGHCLVPEEISTQHAIAIGTLLAKIHACALDANAYKAACWGCYTEAEWQALFTQIASIPELDFLASHLPQFIELSAKARESFDVLNQHLVVSHRDLDAKNVLWQDKQPILIDWEYAGPINPTLERLIVAFNWSEVTSDRPKTALMQAVFEGYDAVNPQLPAYPDDLLMTGYIGYVLAWIYFNCRRALLIKADQPIAKQQIIDSLVALDWAIPFHCRGDPPVDQ